MPPALVDCLRRRFYHVPRGFEVVEAVMHKARTFAEADEYDILQNIRMSPSERRRAALELKRRACGDGRPDVRESTRR